MCPPIPPSIGRNRLKAAGESSDICHDLDVQIGIVNEKLDAIEKRIGVAEGHVKTGNPVEVKAELDAIIFDLHALTPHITGLFNKVDGLKAHGHHKHADYYRL